MTDANACDKCGKVLPASPPRRGQKVFGLLKSCNGVGRVQLHLCEPCMEEFEAWLGDAEPLWNDELKGRRG